VKSVVQAVNIRQSVGIVKYVTELGFVWKAYRDGSSSMGPHVTSNSIDYQGCPYLD